MDWENVVYHLGAVHQIRDIERLWENPMEMTLRGSSETLGRPVRISLQLATNSVGIQCQTIQTILNTQWHGLIPLLEWSVMVQWNTDCAYMCLVWPETTCALNDAIMTRRMEGYGDVIPEDQLTHYLPQLLRCLVVLHSAGIAHGSVDPCHFFFSESEVRLGLWCEPRELQSWRWQHLSPYYTSPSVKHALRDRQLAVTHDAMKTDVYALGLTIVTLAKGQIPMELMEIDTLAGTTSALIDSLPYQYHIKAMLMGMLNVDENLRITAQMAMDYFYSRVEATIRPRLPEVLSFVKDTYSAYAHYEEVQALANTARLYTENMKAQNANSILSPAGYEMRTYEQMPTLDWSMQNKALWKQQGRQYAAISKGAGSKPPKPVPRQQPIAVEKKQESAPLEESKSAPAEEVKCAPVEEKKEISPGGESTLEDLKCMLSSCSRKIDMKGHFGLFCDAQHVFCSVKCCKAHSDARSDKSQPARCPRCDVEFDSEVLKDMEARTSTCAVF